MEVVHCCILCVISRYICVVFDIQPYLEHTCDYNGHSEISSSNCGINIKSSLVACHRILVVLQVSKGICK